MTRIHTPINYNSVAEVCNALTIQGKKPSVRTIREKIGGSFTKISEHLGEWRKQHQLAQSTDAEISSELKQALLAEFARVNNQLEKSLQSEIDDREEELKDAKNLLNDYEEKINKLEQDLIKEKQHADETILALEKKLAVSEGAITDLSAREERLQQKIAELVDQCHQYEIKTAVATANSENYRKRIDELEQQMTLNRKK